MQKTHSIAMQGKRGDSQYPNFDAYSCSKCKITYHHPKGRKAVCPLCEAERTIQAMRMQLDGVQNANRILQQDLARAESQTNSLTAMKDAIPFISEADMMVVKSAAYRWREDRSSITLAPMVDAHNQVSGFALKAKGHPQELYECDSVGGVALATCYAESMRIGGSPKAMELLLRALAWHLSEGQ